MKSELKYAIKFKTVDVNQVYTILLPMSVIKGRLECEDGYFRDEEDNLYCYITNPDGESEYYVGDAYTMEELRAMYECDLDYVDADVLEFFLDDSKDKVSILRGDKRIQFDLFDVFDDTEEKEIYQKMDGESALVLNQNAFDILEDIDDIEILRYKLNSFRDNLSSFQEKNVPEGITAIMVKDGHVCEIDMQDSIKKEVASYKAEHAEVRTPGDVSVSGLYKYLKSHIIGHDEELKNIATILYLNYTSDKNYGTESILIPGPTGVGKTATFKVASNYFDVPFKSINTPNIVPEGIVGTTIEDELASIIDACDGDVEKAERAIIVLDEFDKLAQATLDIKESTKDILLKVLEGASFPINRQFKTTKYFDTTMSSKICLGSFPEAYKREKTLGFVQEGVEKQTTFDHDLLISKGYFSKELLSRIDHFIPYGDLTDEDKKKIILKSKLSVYLLKKKRLHEQFGIDITGDISFANGVLEALKKDSKSIRDINNIISKVFLPIEFEIADNPGKFKTLKLSKNTVASGKFDLS